MRQQKKSNVISLLAYRKKREKQQAKKNRKVSSDESAVVIDEPYQPVKPSQKSKPKAQIYYMSNYRKTKRLPSLEDKSPPEEKLTEKNKGKTINLLASKAETNFQKRKNSKDNVISIGDYLKNKNQAEKAKPAPSYFMAKEAVSFAGIALALLLALNIFFPKTQNEQVAQLKDSQNPSRRLASPDKPLVIQGINPDKEESKIIRRISSIFSPEDSNIKHSRDYIDKIRNMDLDRQTVIRGRKPSSSAYKGF